MTTDLKFQGKKHFGKGSPLAEKMQYEFNYIARESMQGRDTINENPEYSRANIRFAGCRTALFSVRESIFLVYIYLLGTSAASSHCSDGHLIYL